MVSRESKSNYAQDLNHAPSLPRAASLSGLPLLAVLERYAAGTAAIIGKILRGSWFLVGGNRKRQNESILLAAARQARMLALAPQTVGVREPPLPGARHGGP